MLFSEIFLQGVQELTNNISYYQRHNAEIFILYKCEYYFNFFARISSSLKEGNQKISSKGFLLKIYSQVWGNFGNWNLFKDDEKCFKALFVFKIFKFLSWIFRKTSW